VLPCDVYSHLSDDEREQTGLAKASGHSIGAIAYLYRALLPPTIIGRTSAVTTRAHCECQIAGFLCRCAMQIRRPRTSNAGAAVLPFCRMPRLAKRPKSSTEDHFGEGSRRSSAYGACGQRKKYGCCFHQKGPAPIQILRTRPEYGAEYPSCGRG
jgi:hypothetical protein